MEFEGKIIAVLEERTGTSENGTWRVGSYVIEEQGTSYPQRIMFEVWDGRDGRIDRLNIQEGKLMRIWFDINCRENKGKWFNTIRAYDAREVREENPEQKEKPAKVRGVLSEKLSENSEVIYPEPPTIQPSESPSIFPAIEPVNTEGGTGADDLPF